MGDETIGAVDKLPRYDLVISHFMLPFYICWRFYKAVLSQAFFLVTFPLLNFPDIAFVYTALFSYITILDRLLSSCHI
jgi:hypothetical protein